MSKSLNENQLKYLNYKEQFKRLNKALVNGFNLEARNCGIEQVNITVLWTSRKNGQQHEHKRSENRN